MPSGMNTNRTATPLDLPGLPPPPHQPASRYPRDVLAMSAEQLREEWLRQERALTDYDQLIDAIVDAVWPTERQALSLDPAAQSSAIVAGIVALRTELACQRDRMRVTAGRLERADEYIAELEAERDRWRQRCEDAEEQLRSAIEQAGVSPC